MDNVFLNAFLNILCSFGGSFGFAIIFNIKGKDLFYTSIGGIIGWMVFYLLADIIPDEVIRYFIASVSISIFAQTMAKVRKMPRTVFLVIAFIPLVPGYSIYLAMENLLLYTVDEFVVSALFTFKVAMAIATGFLVSSLFYENKTTSNK